MYFDIHSHILPAIDDGAKNKTQALKLLKMMEEDRISDVLATPHFYSEQMELIDFLEDRKNAYESILPYIEDKAPKIYLGAEVLYFVNLGNFRGIKKLTLNNSKYILLEMKNKYMGKLLFNDFELLAENGIIPIIAHIERYYKNKNFKLLLKEVKEKNIPVQINATSFFKFRYKKVIKKIFKMGLFCVLATDTHSVEHRPPLMRNAMKYVSEKYGKKQANRLMENSRKLYNEIIGDNFDQQ